MDEVWTDDGNCTNCGFNSNVPGDGKFDENWFPSPLEVSVSRIDFASLPAFESPPAGTPSKDELALVKQYLAKNDRYRRKIVTYSQKAYSGGYCSDWLELHLNDDVHENALRNGSRFFGIDPSWTVESDLFNQRSSSFVWGFKGGSGTPSIIGNGSNTHSNSVAKLTDVNQEPLVAFSILRGSYFGDWNYSDDLLRECLGTTNYGLASLWIGVNELQWQFESMALGEPLSQGYLNTANEFYGGQIFGPAWLAIMGDATLRLHVIAPPTNLSGTTNTSGNIALTWTQAVETNPQYYVYRTLDTIDGSFTNLTTTPITAATYIDTQLTAGVQIYQVRTALKTVSGSGSYTNLSQGAFWP